MAEVVELAGVGHMVAGDDNAPFTRALVDFLERNIPGKAS
jgi:pimeloyl-ACP methyl ester carboxylesterase